MSHNEASGVGWAQDTRNRKSRKVRCCSCSWSTFRVGRDDTERPFGDCGRCGGKMVPTKTLEERRREIAQRQLKGEP